MWHRLFSISNISLYKLILMFLHVIVCINHLFIFIVQYSIVWVQYFFMYSFDWHLGCYKCFAQTFFGHMYFYYLWITTSAKLLCHGWHVCFTFIIGTLFSRAVGVMLNFQLNVWELPLLHFFPTFVAVFSNECTIISVYSYSCFNFIW